MSNTTKIQWTDATWNPWHGCHKVSPGCKNCYMFREKKQYGQDPNIVVRSKTKFSDPLKWKEPRLIFTCSWSDWFIEEADAWRDEAWDIIRRTPQHTYQILTKRIERAEGRVPIPALSNVWIGVSVEDQQRADERIPLLLSTPAQIRFISAEPLIGPLNLQKGPWDGWLSPCGYYCDHDEFGGGHRPVRGIEWVIVGGESGHGARAMELDWARSIIRQCKSAGVKVFVKQLGQRPRDGKLNTGVPGFGNSTGILTVERVFKDSKGGTMSEWPEDLRIREMPV